MATEERQPMTPGEMSVEQLLWNELADWSNKTFGNEWERGPVGPLKHLKKEADEAITTPNDITEYADCLILVFDAARRAGFEYGRLFDAARLKVETNRTRTYPKPTSDEPSEHIKEAKPNPEPASPSLAEAAREDLLPIWERVGALHRRVGQLEELLKVHVRKIRNQKGEINRLLELHKSASAEIDKLRAALGER